ncbi:MAG: AEC family transporter [Rhizobiaceae bacterium]|nr:AEC family transporter [Rhizobiaceae bacterium]MCV0408788.1 AEC family transporter [Rhizobiaceae bacterium]
MYALVETILLVFGLVALGYGAGAVRYLREDAGDALTEFAVGIALPLLLFRTMARADFHGAAPWAFWSVYFTAVVVAWATGHLVTTKLFGRERQAGVVGGVSAAFSNLVLLGIPFMLGVFGQEGFEILSLLVSVHLPIMILASIVQFRLFSPTLAGGGAIGAARDFVRQILSNPLIIGIAAGLLWRLSGFPLPPLASRFVDALADVAGPVALFAMGLGLRKFGISGNVKPGIALAVVKLGLMPAVALMAAWAVGLPPLTAKVAVAAAALPSGVNSYLIATQLGTGQALASNAMTIATASAVITTAFWIAVGQAVFG